MPRLVRYLAAGLIGRLSTLSEVIYRTARHVAIEGEVGDGGPVPVQVDGDAYGETPVTLELASTRLPVLVPPDSVPGS